MVQRKSPASLPGFSFMLERRISRRDLQHLPAFFPPQREALIAGEDVTARCQRS
jgi:hypothetical protein